jgi:hypothetical protein
MPVPFRHAVITELQRMGVPLSAATRNYDVMREKHGPLSAIMTPAEAAEQAASLKYSFH